MRLISCYIENFGKFSDFRYDFEPGLNVIYHENGWGKSTLMAFIKCMFYGFVGEGKRSTLDSERKRYAPWQGGTFGGRLIFEADGKKYEMIRKWGRKVQEDECTVIDCRTNMPSDRYTASVSGNGSSPGRQIFGIDEDSFARSAFIAHDNVPGGVTGDINARISNIADNTNDMGNYDKAMELLKNRLNAMSENRSTGSLYGIKSRINRLQGEIAAEDALNTSLEELHNRLAETKEKVQLLKRRNEALKKSLDEITEWQDAGMLRERYRLYNKEFCDAKDNYDAAVCEVRRTGEADSGSVRMPGIMRAGIVILAAGGTLSAIGLVLHGIGMTAVIAGLVILAFGLIFTIAGAVTYDRKKKRKAESHAAYKAALIHLDNAAGAYAASGKKMDELERELGNAPYCECDEKSFTDGSGMTFGTVREINDAISRNIEETDRLRQIASSYSTQAEERLELLDEIREKKKTLDQLTEQLKEGRLKVRRMETARDLLAQARINVTSKYITPLSERFAHYFRTVTGTDAYRFVIDAESNVSVNEKGSHHDVSMLSTGLKDVVGLCLRMALVDAMYRNEKPPVIIDDVFACMDEKNSNGAADAVAEISQSYQVIYFTCHKSKLLAISSSELV